MILFGALRGFLNPTMLAGTSPAVLAAREPLTERRLVVSLHHSHQLMLILALFCVEVRRPRKVMCRVILPMVEPGDLLDLGRVVRTYNGHGRDLRRAVAA